MSYDNQIPETYPNAREERDLHAEISVLRAERDELKAECERLKIFMRAAVERGGDLIAQVERLTSEQTDDRETQKALVKRISELTAERVGLSEKHRTHCACRFDDDGEKCVHPCVYHNDIRAEREALRAQLDAARVDSERLDFMDQVATLMYTVGDQVFVQTRKKYWGAKSLRDAIDTARTEGKQ